MKHPSMTEKQSLRKSEFPICAREGLDKVEHLCVPQVGGRPPSAKEMDLAMEIMAEFIFCEVDRRGNKRKLTCVQQLQLAQVLCDHFAGVPAGPGSTGTNGETARNTLFLSLFPPTTSHERAQALVQLVSMAISTKNRPVLASTGIWMQQLGCTSNLVLQLAEGLVKDYFVLVPKAVSCLQDLPTLAPHFTANFLTTVAEIYANIGQNGSFSFPPIALLEVVTEWVSENSSLCLAALMVNLQPLLPLGSIPMAALTPFAGLFKWCVLSPLYHKVIAPSPALNSIKNGLKETKSSVYTNGTSEESTRENNDYNKEVNLYSKLHLALLESLLDNVYSNTKRDVVCAQHLAVIVGPVRNWCEQHQKLLFSEAENVNKDENFTSEESKDIELALDRLGQSVQVALASKCVYGNKQYLLAQLETLKNYPQSRLLNIVLLIQKNVI